MHAMTDIDTASVVSWPNWCYSNKHMESEAQDLVLNINNNNNNTNNNNILPKEEKQPSTDINPPRNRKRYRREGPPNGLTRDTSAFAVNGMPAEGPGDVKAERVSPDPAANLEAGAHHTQQSNQNSPSPSTSPKSPASHRTRTPSFPGTPPNPAFTPPTSGLHPPYDRFSPAALGAMGAIQGGHGALKQMENLMTRNCSDIMRSLAAKYNNSNPNDFFSSPTNGFLRSPLSSIPPFKPGTSPFLGVTPSSVVSTAASRETEKKTENQVSTATASLPPGLAPPGAPPLFAGHGIPGFPGFPYVDMSSTQVLLRMVQNASAAQQSQLENYLRGAMKRPADAPTSPLDLSSSVGAKRPRTDFSKNFDVKSLFTTPSEEEKKDLKLSSPTSPSSGKVRQATSPNTNSRGSAPLFLCNDRGCTAAEGVNHWTVDDVCSFVKSIDLCAEYAEAFREQRIDGSALPLLTEDHLTSSINMKLGPALKLRSVLAKKLGSCNICLHCNHCHTTPERRPASASSGQ